MPTDDTSGEDFERLLAWLDPEREAAGERYEQLRRNLHDYFRRRGALDPQGLADEVFRRVTRKVKEVSEGFVGDPAHYFLAVARRVLAESQRRPAQVSLPEEIPVTPALEPVPPKELLLHALEQCWEQLKPEEQATLLRYHDETAQRPGEERERLARELGLSIGALRVVAHRLRLRLRHCIEKLIEKRKDEMVARILHK